MINALGSYTLFESGFPRALTKQIDILKSKKEKETQDRMEEQKEHMYGRPQQNIHREF